MKESGIEELTRQRGGKGVAGSIREGNENKKGRLPEIRGTWVTEDEQEQRATPNQEEPLV